MAWTSETDAEPRSLYKLVESLVCDGRRIFDRKAGIVASNTTGHEPSGALGRTGCLAVNIKDSKVWLYNGTLWNELTKVS